MTTLVTNLKQSQGGLDHARADTEVGAKCYRREHH